MPRIRGTLVKFDSRQFKSHGYVRYKQADGEEVVLFVPTSGRGVLQGEEIVPCINGDRYDKIPRETPIVMDIDRTTDPFVVRWAPLVQQKRQARVK